MFHHFFLNYIGASIRWIYGSVWSTIFKQQKYTYKEYLNGPENSNDFYDKHGHQFNNKIIGIIGIVVSIAILIRILN